MKAKDFMGLCLVLGVLAFTACRKDDLAKPFNDPQRVTFRTHDCDSVCIDPANPVYFVHEDSIANNSGPNTRVFYLAFYNTLTAFQLDWTYLATNSASRTLHVTVSGSGFANPVSYLSDCVLDIDTGASTFVFDTTWAACDVVSFTAEILDCDGNVLNTLDGSYDLVGQCAACEESFTYVDNDDSTYTFTYISDIDLDSAELVLTFPQAVTGDVEGLDGWTNHGQTFHTTLDITACTEYSWTVTLLPKCSGHSPQSNLWTDFKVNDVSKKNAETPNIVVECPD